VKIVEAGSFSRAATLLYVAQPALSSQIAEFEAELGVTLLNRNARGVTPTPAGHAVYEEASDLLRIFLQIPDAVRPATRATSGSVKLGIVTPLSYLFAAPFMKACKEALPDISLSFFSQDSALLKARLAEHAMDLAVVLEAEPTAGLDRIELFHQRLYLLHTEESHRHTASFSFVEAACRPLITPSASNSWRPLLDTKLAAAGITPNIVAEAHDTASYIAAVKSGIGATLLPMGNIALLPGAESIITTLISDLRLTASVVWAHDRSLPHAAEAVRDVLVAFIQRFVQEQQPVGLEPFGD